MGDINAGYELACVLGVGGLWKEVGGSGWQWRKGGLVLGGGSRRWRTRVVAFLQPMPRHSNKNNRNYQTIRELVASPQDSGKRALKRFGSTIS